MENHHFSWENQLFQWSFSIAFCMFTGGYHLIYSDIIFLISPQCLFSIGIMIILGGSSPIVSQCSAPWLIDSGSSRSMVIHQILTWYTVSILAPVKTKENTKSYLQLNNLRVIIIAVFGGKYTYSYIYTHTYSRIYSISIWNEILTCRNQTGISTSHSVRFTMIYGLSISGMKLLLRPLICPGSTNPKMFDNNMAVGSVPSALGFSRSPEISKKTIQKPWFTTTPIHLR